MLYRLYARYYGLEYGESGNPRHHLNFIVYTQNGMTFPKLTQALQYSSSMAQVREILKKYGIQKPYSETSFKCGGVTAYLEAGATLESTMIHGRWRNLHTPLFYLRQTTEFRLRLAKRVPLISPEQFEI